MKGQGIKILSQSNLEHVGSINKYREQRKDAGGLKNKFSALLDWHSTDIPSHWLQDPGKGAKTKETEESPDLS